MTDSPTDPEREDDSAGHPDPTSPAEQRLIDRLADLSEEPEPWTEPPPGLRGRLIDLALDDLADASPRPDGNAARPATPVSPTVPRPSSAAADRPAPATGPARVSRRSALVGAATALGIGAIGGVLGIWLGTRPPRPEVVTSVQLVGPDDPDERGTAQLLRTGGRLELRLTLDPVPQVGPDEILQVWLIHSQDQRRLIPIGTYVGTGPAIIGVDDRDLAGGYTVVDVSVEPLDDDPAHSGLTVVRGALPW